jgi:hypothetical protein
LIRVCSIFSQLLQLFPRAAFAAAVRQHHAERHARGFDCWTQFIAMLFCQLGRAQSLREICGGLAASEGKLRHLGVERAPKCSTLAYANEHRPWELFQSVFASLLARCQGEAQSRQRKFRFRNPLLSIDSTIIQLSLSAFDWASYQREKGAAKLHLVLDHDGYLPSFAVVKEGKSSDLSTARAMRFTPGTTLVFDRGYQSYKWFAELTGQGVFFVTRLRDFSRVEILKPHSRPNDPAIQSDQVVRIGSQRYRMKEDLRLVTVTGADGESVLFVTNIWHLAASTISAIYRDRWQIEVFFRALKQNLRVKSFVGTSQNAVQIQIWTALIALLLIKYLQLRSSFGWSLSNPVALLRQQLLVYRDLWTWLDEPFEPPPQPVPVPHIQLLLALG